MIAHINPDIFLIFVFKEIVLWDFKQHIQYALDQDHANRLLDIVKTGEFDARVNSIDATLHKQNIISERPFITHEWGWDVLARIFHLGTKDIPQENIPKTRYEWATQYATFCSQLLKTPTPPTYSSSLKSENIKTLPLPTTQALQKISLWETLLKRKTCRRFFPNITVSLETFSTVLYASLGFLKERKNDISQFVPPHLSQRRSSPSGGGT